MLKNVVTGAAMISMLAGSASAQSGNAFSFVAWGDMPYSLPNDYTRVDRVIAAINAAKPAFTLHVGDVKSGSSVCSDEVLKNAFDQINTVEAATVYTIGDNEWTDCHRERAGRFDPRERLAKVRQLAFNKPGVSLGKTPMQVESQAIVMAGAHAKFVENQRFVKNGVLFVTVHVPGSNNGFEPGDPGAAVEYHERNAANVAWLEAGFKQAADAGVKAVVIWFQANPYDIRQTETPMPRASGFTDTIQAIEKGAKATGNKPLLVIHGDNHVLELANLLDTSMKPIPNTYRLQLFGETRLHAMRIVVDPESPGVFGFVPLIVPENGAF